MCKSKGVEIFLLPRKCTNILQQLDKAVFSNLKREFLRHKDNWARQRRGHRVTHADCVHIFCEAWRLGVTTQKILSGFLATGIFPFDFARFVAHAPRDRIRHTAPVACPQRGTASAPTRLVEESTPTGSQEQTARSEARTQCSGRHINDAMRAEGDVYSLRLGGSVTSDDFVHTAQQSTTQRSHNAASSPHVAASSSQVAPWSPRIAASSSRIAPKGRQLARKRKSSRLHSGGVRSKASCRTPHDQDSADDSDWHPPHTVHEQPYSASDCNAKLLLSCVSDFE